MWSQMYLLVITTVFCCGFCKCKAPLKGKGNRMQFYRLHMKKKKKKKVGSSRSALNDPLTSQYVRMYVYGK